MNEAMENAYKRGDKTDYYVQPIVLVDEEQRVVAHGLAPGDGRMIDYSTWPIACLLLIFTAGLPLNAQSNELIDELLDQEQARYGLAVYLALVSEDASARVGASA